MARLDGTYTNLLKKYSRFKLLILDDFGVAPMQADDATNLFVPQGQASRKLLKIELS
ncbi:MAG: hypothetical protein U9N33_11930 [Campylobacterota bacterium]|nr:hypothetical protein [Campylobacterota bacterium]